MACGAADRDAKQRHGRRVYLLNTGSLVNLAAGLGIGPPQLFDRFAAIMLLGLDAILRGRPQICRTACIATRVRWRRVARALATGSA
jgi:adenosylhomocysteinase